MVAGWRARFWRSNHRGWDVPARGRSFLGMGDCCGGGEETPEMREEKGCLHGRRGPTRVRAPRRHTEAYRRGWIRGARERRNIEAAAEEHRTDPEGEIGAAYGRGYADGRASAPRPGNPSPVAADGGLDEAAAYAAGYPEGRWTSS